MSKPVYSYRPSKDVTRRIFVDALRRTVAAEDLERYQYIGFGALDFVDFDLVHSSLGISRMTSIESDLQHIERYRANSPYSCIEVKSGRSSDELVKLDWDGLAIVWLDYESQLNRLVLDDITLLCNKLVPGSVIAVTLNADPGSLTGRRIRLEGNVGAELVPDGTDDDTLGEWGLAAVQQRILYAKLRNRLSKRPDQGTWWQFLNINYRDGARMQLVAGVICTPVLESSLESRRLDRVGYYRPGPEPMRIEIPYLTPHEQRLLRHKLPRKPGTRLPRLPGVDPELVKNYSDYYQWINAS